MERFGIAGLVVDVIVWATIFGVPLAVVDFLFGFRPRTGLGEGSPPHERDGEMTAFDERSVIWKGRRGL